MNKTRVLFWNVDTQKDFMLKNGKLYIPGAEEIIPKLKMLTDSAKKYNIKVVNTGDYHTERSKELSKNPDFKTTFPEHCIAGTEGTEFIDETNPKEFKGNYDVITWLNKYIMHENIDRSRNIIIFKDDFDVFKGNQHTEEILKRINPEMIFVYGVATNVCVDFAVRGLASRGKQVMIIFDAIKGLPGFSEEHIYENWRGDGVEFTNVEKTIKFLEMLSKFGGNIPSVS